MDSSCVVKTFEFDSGDVYGLESILLQNHNLPAAFLYAFLLDYLVPTCQVRPLIFN